MLKGKRKIYTKKQPRRRQTRVSYIKNRNVTVARRYALANRYTVGGTLPTSAPRVIISICSKYPNPDLYECIDNLYKIQIKGDKNYELHVIDSDSNDYTYYKKIEQSFPDVKIHMIKNKNYEYGAWKYILNTYPNFDIYFCIQDTNIINKYIDLNILDDKKAYTFHNLSGYNSHPSIKTAGIENLKGSGLNYEPIIHTNFMLAQHSSFIINNKIIKDIFKHLTIPPTNKESGCFYERNFGIYFICKGINTINLYDYMHKKSGGR